MKRVLVVLMVMAMMGVGTNAYGAALSYDPTSIDTMELAPGESASAKVTVVSADQKDRVIYVNMKGKVSNGNLPAEWISGKAIGLTSRAGSVNTEFTWL